VLAIAALLSVYVSFALLYAANPERLPLEWQNWPRQGWGHALRWTALGALGAAVLLFLRGGEGDATLLIASSGLMTVYTIFILLISVWPKAMWTLAFVSLPAILGLVALGADHG
jgi:hypothetical protein